MTHLSLNVNSPLLHPLQVHPIFVLSLADCMLAVLWVVGGILWLRRTPYMSRVGCYSTSLLTIVGTPQFSGVVLLHLTADHSGCT